MIGEAASLVAALCWAIGLLLFRGILERHSSAETNLRKCLSATGMFWIAAAFGTFPAFTGEVVLLLVLSGIVGMSVGDTLLFSAMRRLGPARALMLHSTAPIFAAGLAWLWQGEVLDLVQLLGVGATCVGISLVLLDRRSGEVVQDERALVSGVVHGLGAAASQGLGVVLAREALLALAEDVNLMAVCALRLSASAVLLALLVGRRRPAVFRDGRAWREALWPSFVGTFFGIFFMIVGLDHTSAGIAGALTATTPLFVVLLGFLWLRRRYRLPTVLGVAVGVFGVGLLCWPSS